MGIVPTGRDAAVVPLYCGTTSQHCHSKILRQQPWEGCTVRKDKPARVARRTTSPAVIDISDIIDKLESTRSR